MLHQLTVIACTKSTTGRLSKGPKEQTVAWNTHLPSFAHKGLPTCTTLSLLDAITEDLGMIQSIVGQPLIPRSEFEKIQPRLEEKVLPSKYPAPRVWFYIPPLKGSATIGGGGTSDGRKTFLPTLNRRRVKADHVDAPDFIGAISLKLEDVLTGLTADCQKAYASTEEVSRADEPEILLDMRLIHHQYRGVYSLLKNALHKHASVMLRSGVVKALETVCLSKKILLYFVYD